MKLEKVCLVEFHRKAFKIPTLHELIGALMSSFSSLGVPVRYFQNEAHPEAVNIVFGLHRLFQDGAPIPAFPPNSIFFNMDPLLWETPDDARKRYFDFLRTQPVIDYSVQNIGALHEQGNARCHRFSFGYTPLSPYRFPRGNQFLFFGVITPRRKQVIGSLLERKVPVTAVTNYWGFERDYQIASARAVVNISKGPDSVLESYRLWHSLCLGTPVISEPGKDAALADEWREYVTFVPDLASPPAGLGTQLVPAEIYRRKTSFEEEARSLAEWIRQL